MIYVNQILSLVDYGLKKNKKFLKSIYEERNFFLVKKWFDFLNCSKSWRRETDKSMNLDKFLSKMDKEIYISLQLASPDPFKIKYGASFKDISNIERFIFMEMPYNNYNFNLISKIYKDSFNKKLESEKVQKGLVEYYKQRVK